MLEFIVLGIIPGTSTQLTLTWIAGLGTGVFCVLALLHARRRVIMHRTLTTLADTTASA